MPDFLSRFVELSVSLSMQSYMHVCMCVCVYDFSTDCVWYEIGYTLCEFTTAGKYFNNVRGWIFDEAV